MNFVQRTQQAVSMTLAAMVTLTLLFSLNGLAAPDAPAVSQLVAAASAPRA